MNKPPPRREKKSRVSENVARVQADAKKVDEIRKKADGLLFFDHQSPKTRASRAAARQVFEEYCERKVGSTDLSDEEMWNAETIIERTCDLILTMGVYATGLHGGKPKAGVLQKQKYGMYWWAIRFIPTFAAVYQRWHHLTTAAIQKSALDFKFTTASQEKNKLTDAELELFWIQLSKFKTGRENWKQHYIAWLMVYILAVRPGSFTVCEGYGKDNLLSNGSKRAEDETLRWSDVVFVRQPGVGLIVRVTFRYLKGYRNQHTKKHVEGKRSFKLLPLNSDRYEFDLGLLLTALAFSRGLFPTYPSIDALFQGTERLVQKSPTVDKQAVFLASNQAGTLNPDASMHESSLNPQLRKMCDEVGFLGRNTMYSFRRAAITKVRREKGTELARELAAHVPEGRSLYAYDDEGLDDYDVVNEAMNVTSMDRIEIGKMFRQVNTSRIELPADLGDSTTPAAGGASTGLQDTLNTEARARGRKDEQYIEQENLLRDHLGVIAEHLDVPTVFMRNINEHREQLMSKIGSDDQAQGLLDTLDQLVRDRTNKLRWLVVKYKREIREEMKTSAQKEQKVIEQQAGASQTGVGFANQVEAGVQASVRQAVTAQGATYVGAIEGLDVDGDAVQVEAEEDEEGDEQAADHGRIEPQQWEDLPDEVTLQPGQDAEEGGATYKGRVQFVETFVQLQSEQTSNLPCIHCKLDPTVPFDKKKQTYTLTNLDKHLKSTYHTREQQIDRAVMIDGGSESTRKTEVTCPLCQEQIVAGKFLKHVREDHEEAIAG